LPETPDVVDCPVQEAIEERDVVVSIVIPAYNEQDAILDVLGEITRVMDSLDVCYETIVVDDGSTDETRERCEQFGNVRVIEHGRNRGVGAARTTPRRRGCADHRHPRGAW